MSNVKKPDDKKESRKPKRYAIKGCTVQSKPDSFIGLFSKTSAKYIVLDISRKGLHFIAKKEFKTGSRILLSISAPVLKGEVIHVKCHVAWVKNMPDLHVCGVGAEFGVMEPVDRGRLKRLLVSAGAENFDISSTVSLNKVEKL